MVEYLGVLNRVYAEESGSGNEDTTFEKEFKAEFTNKVEQTEILELTQPEGITRPIEKKPHVIHESEVIVTEEKEDNEVEVHDDGGKRFEKVESEEFHIRRPRGGFELRRKRREE